MGNLYPFIIISSLLGLHKQHPNIFIVNFELMQKIIQIMFSRRSLPILFLVLGAGIFIAFRSMGGGGNPPGKYEKILHNVGEMLQQAHFSPKEIDDKFSKELFKQYFTEVDLDKDIFLQSDINDHKKYEIKLDDEIRGGAVEFVPSVSTVFKKRLLEVEAIAKEMLTKPIDITKDETFVSNPEKRNFPASEAERKDVWRKRIKYLYLEKYADMLENQEKNKGTKDFVVKTNEEIDKLVRERLTKLLEKNFDRYKFKLTDDDRFNIYVKLVTNSMDPHTDYLPPVDKRSFDEEMSGEFYGIGASLRDEDGAIKIATVMAGSPAWKSGQLSPGDIVIKVGQGEEEPVDVVASGYNVQDAVKIIRGKKGTEVRLTVRKADGTTRQVKMVREKIVQDETYARSVVVNNGKSKIGLITLPEFYANFDDPNGRRCGDDVAKEIAKLKEEKVEGIIIDLRNNGGGSLYEVVKMVGLFVEDGPVVQVKDRDGKPSVLRDRDKSVLYDGPLAVMVNEFSASASEIFAAAIQDYKRGIIIGSTTTFGKGTVQRNIGIDKDFGFNPNAGELGSVKLTLQKFYRINGGSTQLKGVQSDVVLPDLYEYSDYREKDESYPLPWDEISKADYRDWKYGVEINAIRTSSQARVASSPAFTLIKNNTQWLAKERDKVVSLQIDKFREEKKRISAIVKELDSAFKSLKEMDIALTKPDAEKFSKEKEKEERFIKPWLKVLKTDIYVNETVNIMGDMVNQFNLVYNKSGSANK
jgi:carboxyl-terminal processing protease